MWRNIFPQFPYMHWQADTPSDLHTTVTKLSIKRASVESWDGVLRMFVISNMLLSLTWYMNFLDRPTPSLLMSILSKICKAASSSSSLHCTWCKAQKLLVRYRTTFNKEGRLTLSSCVAFSTLKPRHSGQWDCKTECQMHLQIPMSGQISTWIWRLQRVTDSVQSPALKFIWAKFACPNKQLFWISGARLACRLQWGRPSKLLWHQVSPRSRRQPTPAQGQRHWVAAQKKVAKAMQALQYGQYGQGYLTRKTNLTLIQG